MGDKKNFGLQRDIQLEFPDQKAGYFDLTCMMLTFTFVIQPKPSHHYQQSKKDKVETCNLLQAPSHYEFTKRN